MPSKRTLASKSPLDTADSRGILASIKRGLRRVEREVRALQPTATPEPEEPITWDAEEFTVPDNPASLSNVGKA